MSVAVILPTYCEAENIESLIREIQELDLKLTIAVIDDSSPDGTSKLVRKLQKKMGNQIRLVSRSDKLGLGTAIADGFRFLLNQEKPPDYVIAMDADYSHNPKDIPRLVETARSGYDIVVGSRYLRGGKVIGSSLRRRLISRAANVVAAIVTRTTMHDCTSGFRCYSRRYVKNVLPSLHSQTYEIQIETLKQARLNGFKIKEIPITFLNRKRGRSKLTAAEAQAFVTYVMRALLSTFAIRKKPVTKTYP